MRMPPRCCAAGSSVIAPCAWRACPAWVTIPTWSGIGLRRSAWACTASGHRRRWPSRRPSISAAWCTSRRDPPPSGSGPLSLARRLSGGYAEPPAEPLDAAISFAPVGTVAVFALGDVAPGGTVVINAIHLDQVPAFPYRLLWEERVLRSVANVTHRDAVEYLELAAAIPVSDIGPHVWPDRCQCRARRPGGGRDRCREQPSSCRSSGPWRGPPGLRLGRAVQLGVQRVDG